VHYRNEKSYQQGSIEIPYEIAKQIMDDCKFYPRSIVSFAERFCKIEANKKQTPVGKVAIKESWFELSE